MSEQEEKAVTPVSDDILSALLMGSTWGERGRIMFDGREEPIIPTADQLETMLVGSTWAERTGVGLRDRTWEDMNEEEREYCRKWMMEKLCSWEGVRAIAAYMDSKKEKGSNE